MAQYLISFPSVAMVVPEGELEAVGRAASAVIEEAKAAGVHLFAGGIDEGVPPALVSASGTVTEGGGCLGIALASSGGDHEAHRRQGHQSLADGVRL